MTTSFGPATSVSLASAHRVTTAGTPCYVSPFTNMLPSARVITSSTPLYQQQRHVVPTTVPSVVAGPGYTQGAYESKHHGDPQLANLKELQRTCGLNRVPVGEALAVMQQVSREAGPENGQVFFTHDQFLTGYAAIMQSQGIEMPSGSVTNAVFDLFDRDDNKLVDLMELICGMSLLCSGSEEEKINAVFSVFDVNGDGFIAMDEMCKFLTSVFKVVLTPNVMAVMNSMGVKVDSAQELAAVTALECFKQADLNADGKLAVDEFTNWFHAPRSDPAFLLSPVRKILQ